VNHDAAANDVIAGCDAVLLDLDGTLIDSNYQHAIAWFRAFRAAGLVVPMWRLHRHVGMGGDQLVKAVAGAGVEVRLGEGLRKAEAEEFAHVRDECEPLEGVRELIDVLKRRGLRIVLASSAPEKDLGRFLGLLALHELVDGSTSASDVDRSKPHPDIVEVALERAGSHAAVMVGDSRWDVEAAAAAGLASICVITGGWSEQELLEAGAAAVFGSLMELAAALEAGETTRR
jgi:HAD superfamily hydrolase (TIGR01549 family)